MSDRRKGGFVTNRDRHGRRVSTSVKGCGVRSSSACCSWHKQHRLIRCGFARDSSAPSCIISSISESRAKSKPRPSLEWEPVSIRLRQSLYEMCFNLKLSGNEVHYTISIMLLVKIMLCSKPNSQKVFKLKHISYKI